MAFELAIKDGFAHPFSVLRVQEREIWKGLHNFMCRHPRLKLRKHRVTSASRVQGFTKENVAKFFYIFEPVLLMINFYPHSRGEFRPRQTRQLPRAVDLKGRLLSCQSY